MRDANIITLNENVGYSTVIVAIGPPSTISLFGSVGKAFAQVVITMLQKLADGVNFEA